MALHTCFTDVVVDFDWPGHHHKGTRVLNWSFPRSMSINVTWPSYFYCSEEWPALWGHLQTRQKWRAHYRYRLFSWKLVYHYRGSGRLNATLWWSLSSLSVPSPSPDESSNLCPVILQNKTAAQFRGFMLEARVTGMVDESPPVGTFILLDASDIQLLTCGNQAVSNHPQMPWID